ncbi:SusC/RagA family protein [Chitinophaga caeni]|uniref:SusC/RagA family protein n=1 Tax=Chitinophaga caeni TaxID=2029983 RepID=A0A291QVN8_9BACT|nr:SusC/RagA family TonB-linked outer membrane protein [Chitinophaga caeni]ATL48026.1 SusC/RagA family protein [Chitinophaga caeni]
MRTFLRLLTIFSLVMLVLPGTMWAQQKAITGTVIAEGEGPIPGATVRVKGTQRITQSDVKGQFKIEAATGEILEISYVGYETKEVVIGTSTTLSITLQTSQESLGEVVVTAMGIKKEKKALGYSVQEVRADELMRNKNANLVNSLNGKVAGLNITNSGGAPGASASIIIRGGTSLERNNQPLFVIDGMPMDNSTGQGDNSAFDGSVNLSTTNSNRAMDINPEDIESISVLKGPAASALYGLRAAAGAIIITTKRGSTGSTNININSRYTNNWANRLPDQQKIYKQGSYYGGAFTDQTMTSWGDPFASGEKQYDNMEDFFQHANAFDNNISISGGNANGNFYLSASDLYQSGIVPTTDFKRSTVRLNAEQKKGIFTFGVNATYSKSKTQKTLTGSGLWGAGGNGYMETVVTWPRNLDMKHYLNDDGGKYRLFPDQDTSADVDNPYWIINKNPQSDRNSRIVGSAYVNAKITDWFDASYRLGIDNYTSTFRNLISPGSGVKEAWYHGMLSETNKNYSYLYSNLLLTFHKKFKDWDLSLIAGTSAENTYIKSTSVRAEDFVIPGFISLENATTDNQYFNDNISRNRIVGAFGDLKIGYKNMIYLGFTGRNDWTSTFARWNRSFFYPSANASFIFTELMQPNKVLSFGKIRASIAGVGKDANPYQTNTYLFGPEETIGGGFRNYWSRGNEGLKPEYTYSYEFGTELRFLNNRLGFDATYYINRSVDQILTPRVSNATGYILSSVNTGEIQNKGIEFIINATPIKNKNLTWDVALNFSHNNGRVKSLPGDISILYVTDVQIGYAKAASFNDGYFMGLSGSKWQTDSTGALLLDWNTGYPLTSTSTTDLVGNREPKFIGGINNSFTFKNFNLNFLIDFRKGGDVYNGTDYLLTAYGMSKETEKRGEEMTFTGKSLNPGTGKYEDVTRTVEATEQFYRDIYVKNSPFFIQEVNWVRLRAINLSYSLPTKVLNRTNFLKGATLTLSGTNLLLLTNYDGMDPETSAAGAGVVGSGSSGIDYAGVPNTAGFSVGLNLKF